MKIYIIRHGETTGDVEDRYGGAYDDHLNKKGILQAKKLAKTIQSFGIQKIFTSSLIRAKETTSILNEGLKVEVEELPDLRERNLNGKLSGMRRSEAKIKFPELVEALKDYRNTIEGAESYEDARDRMINGFKKVISSDKDIVAVVTHGGFIRSIFREILDKEIESISDCGFAELEDLGGRTVLKSTAGIILK